MGDVVAVCKPLTATGRVQDVNGTNIGAGRYLRCVVLNPATTVCRVVVYDNTTNSGTILADVTGAANDKSVPSPDYRIPITTALYAVITGAPTSVMVFIE